MWGDYYKTPFDWRWVKAAILALAIFAAIQL
jgi:hypothetical protein